MHYHLLMKHHKLLGRLDKERDYLVIEARPFFSDLGYGLEALLVELKFKNEVSQNTIATLTNLVDKLKNKELANIAILVEKARQLCWDDIQSQEQQTSHMNTFLLFMTNLLSELMWLVSKSPGEYDMSIRHESLTKLIKTKENK